MNAKKTYTKLNLTKDEIVDLINSKPQATNVELGEILGVSRERVRQLRVQFGLKNVKDFNQESFNKVMINIENGYGVLTNQVCENIPNLGLKKLKQWMAQDSEIKRQVENALQKTYEKHYNPQYKVCVDCEVNLPINQFYPDKAGRDKRNRRCNDCNIAMVKSYYNRRYTPVPVVTSKLCTVLKELGPLPASFFYRSTKTTTGLQYACKQYQHAYDKYRTFYNKTMKIEDEYSRQVELNILGDWKAKAKKEAMDQAIIDLREFNSTDEVIETDNLIG